MKKQNTTKEIKEENILDSFPNPHFASAFGFYGENQTQELEEKTRLFNETMQKMRERCEQQKREYEALSEEEKQKLAEEELKYKQKECDKVHAKLLETYPDVNQEIYQAMCEIISAQRKLFDEYKLSYIIETLENRYSFHSIYEEYSKHFVEDKALILSSHSRYTAIAKHSYPALLWIYTHKKDILCNLENNEVIFIIHPEIINVARLEKKRKTFEGD